MMATSEYPIIEAIRSYISHRPFRSNATKMRVCRLQLFQRKKSTHFHDSDFLPLNVVVARRKSLNGYSCSYV